MDLERKQDETRLEHHRRLVYGKLIDKTLADVDYAELSEYIYGKAFSSDVCRRMLYGSKYTLELMDEAKLSGTESGSSPTDDIDSRLAELRREQQRYYDQRREYHKMLNEEGRAEHLHEILAKAAESLGEQIGFFTPRETEIDAGENEAVLVFADWHYGMTTDNIFNHYDTETCRDRVWEVVNKAVDRILLHRCGRVHIIVLGDLFHGAIHTSARVASEELACEQLMHVSELLAQAIHEISEYTNETKVYLTYGNHGRTVANKKDNLHRDNLERLVGWWLRERFRYDDRIEIVSESQNEFVTATVCGHDLCASHGDLDSVQNSPRLLATLFQKKLGRDLEYILLGDKHHRESFSELGVTALLCGSLCGTDDYANGKRLYSSPSQLLLVMNQGCGVDAEYRLSCSETPYESNGIRKEGKE